MSLQYQNPNSANVTSVLDSEQLATDSATSQPLVREFVVPQESIAGQSSLTQIVDLLSQMLSELKKMTILLQQDQVPEGISQADELADSPPAEEMVTEGLEEF